MEALMGEAKQRGSFYKRKSQALERQALENKTKPLNRFFKNKEQALAFLDGDVWISTLQKCREFEDPQQGDIDEGSSTFHQEFLTIKNRIITEEDIAIANLVGVRLPAAGSFYDGEIVLENNLGKTLIKNGFLLCTTNDPVSLQAQSPEWEYGIEINMNPDDFFRYLTMSLLIKKIPISKGRHDWADYDTARIYRDYTQKLENLAFLKPNIHKKQSEYRFFWETRNHFEYPPNGILIKCPQVKPFLRKLF